MKINQLETPALVLDLDLFENNVTHMMGLLQGSQVRLRPHFKTHKATAISKKLIAAGAKGITCAKLSEAAVLAYGGVQDILIANEIVDPIKLKRLAALERKSRVTVCVDCEENIRELSRAATEEGVAIPCYVEFNTGLDRCGVDTFEEVAHLAAVLTHSPGLSFDGIQAYAGQVSHEHDTAIRRAVVEDTEDRLALLKAYLEERGLPVREISGGSTGTAELKAGSRVYTELQAGSFVYMDAEYNTVLPGYQTALTLLASVISIHPKWIVTDAGVKSCSVDHGPPQMREFPEAAVRMSEEHATITVDSDGVRLMDKVTYIPTHCCTTINLHDTLYLVRGDTVVDTVPVDGSHKSL